MALVLGRPPVAVRAPGVVMPSGGRRLGEGAAAVRQMSLMYDTCALHEYVKLLPCARWAAHVSGCEYLEGSPPRKSCTNVVLFQ